MSPSTRAATTATLAAVGVCTAFSFLRILAAWRRRRWGVGHLDLEQFSFAIQERGYTVLDGLLGTAYCDQIAKEIRDLRAGGHLSPGKLQHGLAVDEDAGARGDLIRFFRPDDADLALHDVSSLRSDANGGAGARAYPEADAGFDLPLGTGDDAQGKGEACGEKDGVDEDGDVAGHEGAQAPRPAPGAGAGPLEGIPALRGYCRLIEDVRQGLAEDPAFVRAVRGTIDRCKYMCACYPGGGARYVKHRDAWPAKPGRKVTLILYLNSTWRPSDGGCLRLWPETPSGSALEPVTLEPRCDRLVAFCSWLEHEVLPAHRERLAVTTWLYNDKDAVLEVIADQMKRVRQASTAA